MIIQGLLFKEERVFQDSKTRVSKLFLKYFKIYAYWVYYINHE